MRVIHQHRQFDVVRCQFRSDRVAIVIQTWVQQKQGHPVLIPGLQSRHCRQSVGVCGAKAKRGNQHCLMVVIPSHVVLHSCVVDQGKIPNALTGEGSG